jgi:glutamate synthase domain-containing protein 1
MGKDESNIEAEKEFTELTDNCNLKIIHWRVVPVNSEVVGEIARSNEPLIKQVFIVDNPEGRNNELKNLNFAKRVIFKIFILFFI